MANLMHTDKLTVIIKVPFDETTTIERARKYFLEANYQELYDERPIMKFRRSFKTKDKMPQFLLKSFFLDGYTKLDPNNRYSLARLNVKPENDGVIIKVSFEEYDHWSESYFILKILRKEIESLKNTLNKDIFEPIKMDNARRTYYFSVFIAVLWLLYSAIILVAAFIALPSVIWHSASNIMITFIIIGIVTLGTYYLYIYWYKKRLQKEIGSTIKIDY